MGSAESSTLDSVDCLASTLKELNCKLSTLENVHLQHEKPVCNDDMLVIAQKTIQCISSVYITVGPVLGTVGCNFARILVETNKSVDISLNVFVSVTDESTQVINETFVYSKVPFVMV